MKLKKTILTGAVSVVAAISIASSASAIEGAWHVTVNSTYPIVGNHNNTITTPNGAVSFCFKVTSIYPKGSYPDKHVESRTATIGFIDKYNNEKGESGMTINLPADGKLHCGKNAAYYNWHIWKGHTYWLYAGATWAKPVIKNGLVYYESHAGNADIWLTNIDQKAMGH